MRLMEKALRDAAIWDEVKDRLKKNALGMSGGSSSGFALPEPWRCSRRCF